MPDNAPSCLFCELANLNLLWPSDLGVAFAAAQDPDSESSKSGGYLTHNATQRAENPRCRERGSNPHSHTAGGF